MWASMMTWIVTQLPGSYAMYGLEHILTLRQTGKKNLLHPTYQQQGDGPNEADALIREIVFGAWRASERLQRKLNTRDPTIFTGYLDASLREATLAKPHVADFLGVRNASKLESSTSLIRNSTESLQQVKNIVAKAQKHVPALTNFKRKRSAYEECIPEHGGTGVAYCSKEALVGVFGASFSCVRPILWEEATSVGNADMVFKKFLKPNGLPNSARYATWSEVFDFDGQTSVAEGGFEMETYWLAIGVYSTPAAFIAGEVLESRPAFLHVTTGGSYESSGSFVDDVGMSSDFGNAAIYQLLATLANPSCDNKDWFSKFMSKEYQKATKKSKVFAKDLQAIMEWGPVGGLDYLYVNAAENLKTELESLESNFTSEVTGVGGMMDLTHTRKADAFLVDLVGIIPLMKMMEEFETTENYFATLMVTSIGADDFNAEFWATANYFYPIVPTRYSMPNAFDSIFDAFCPYDYGEIVIANQQHIFDLPSEFFGDSGACRTQMPQLERGLQEPGCKSIVDRLLTTGVVYAENVGIVPNEWFEVTGGWVLNGLSLTTTFPSMISFLWMTHFHDDVIGSGVEGVDDGILDVWYKFPQYSMKNLGGLELMYAELLSEFVMWMAVVQQHCYQIVDGPCYEPHPWCVAELGGDPAMCQCDLLADSFNYKVTFPLLLGADFQ